MKPAEESYWLMVVFIIWGHITDYGNNEQCSMIGKATGKTETGKSQIKINCNC